MFFQKKHTISFSQSLEELIWLLTTVNEQFWLKHIEKFKNGSGGIEFQSIYGGMGSFNDLSIYRINNHEVETSKEPLANQLLCDLSSICYACSNGQKLSANSAIQQCATHSQSLSGWRCLDCGFSQASTSNLLRYAAYIEVRQAIVKGIEENKFSKILRGLWDNFNQQRAIADLLHIIELSDIAYSTDEGWMRPCPNCSENDTCIYRWNFENNKFIASSDNLPLKI